MKTTDELVNMALAMSGVVVEAEPDTLTKRLFERRITSEVIATFQIEPHGNGWQYPTPGGGIRFKNYNSDADAKYVWLKSEPTTALYYAEDLKEQVRAAGGVCWYVSGEPDVWAMRSAGIAYAFSGFTEKTINPLFANFLQNMGVTRLYIAPDLDETGAAWACKVAAALEGTGIDLDCRQLPAELGQRGDIGKAWQKYTARTPFIYWLLGLPRWHPEPEKPKPETTLVLSTGEWGDIPADYRKRIMDACGVTKIRGAGFSNKVLCPIHKENVPSADFHEQKGLFCFHEMRWYKWVEVGAALGIEPFKQEKPTHVLAHRHLAVEAQKELIRRGYTALCRVLTELYLNGFEGGEALTLKELQAACPILSPWTVREAMRQAHARSEFLRVFFPSSATRKERKKNLKKSLSCKASRGRTPKVFHIPALKDIYTLLRVKPEACLTNLSEHSRESVAQFRAEVVTERIRREPGDYAIKQLTKPTGISAPTFRAYCKRANIEVTPNFDISKPLTAEEIQRLPKDTQELMAWKREGKFYRWQSWLETLDGKYKFAPTQEGALRAGKRPVRLVKRLASHYEARKT